MDEKKITPQQIYPNGRMNGTECGISVMTTADLISDNLPLRYKPSDMPFLRHKIASAVLRDTLNTRTTDLDKLCSPSSQSNKKLRIVYVNIP